MDRQKLHKLIVLWIVSYILVNISGVAIMLIRGLSSGVYEYPGFHSGFHFFTVIAVAVYFIPLLLRILKLSKELKEKIIMLISILLCVFFAVWEVFSIVGILMT